MITCKFSACASFVIIDGNNQSLSVINILDEINVPLPGILGTFSAVFLLIRDADDPEKMETTASAGMIGGEAQKFPVSIDFQGKRRTRLVMQMAGVPLMRAGTFRVELLRADSTVLGDWNIEVNALNPPAIVG